MSEIRPNTFLIGAQKSATTSVYNWIGQHPEVCAPISMKDFPYFSNDEFFEQGIDSLMDAYKIAGYTGQKIILQGCVQYMFFPKAIERIYEFNPKAKLIAVLRDPVDRAISAYRFFKKQQIENKTLLEALELEDERLNSGNYSTICDLTYQQHGLYGEQLRNVYAIYPKRNLLVINYSDVQNDPAYVIKELIQFLEIENDFTPEFKVYNQTGQLKFPLLHHVLFGKNKLKKAIIDHVVEPVFPLHKRNRLRWKIREWNTKKADAKFEDNFIEEREHLKKFYARDIDLLEEITEMDFSAWK